MAVVAAAAEALLDVLWPSIPRHQNAATGHAYSVPQILTLVVALTLLILAPRLWGDRPKAASLVVLGLLALTALDLAAGAAHLEAIPQASLALVLVGWVGLEIRSAAVPAPNTHAQLHNLAVARGLVKSHGDDSLSPFILRPDKAFHLAGGGVLAYRLIGRTAVVSGDPVGPEGSAEHVLRSFLESAGRRGWRVVIYGASSRHLESYRGLGLQALCVGEEAVVDPARFSLEGRAVRKLRQSVHRVQRYGWRVHAYDGREIDAELEAEIDEVERAWRAGQRRLFGFAMGMGAFEPGVGAADVYLLGRGSDGQLMAVMRFIWHRGKLSLDTMRRIGETPNGLNEAMVCHALEIARQRGIREVSLNYAGLAHLVRCGPRGSRLRRAAIRVVMKVLSRQFQMHRLVRFNQKFDPAWHPRYLVYQSRPALPPAIFRVLQAEGYLAGPSRMR